MPAPKRMAQMNFMLPLLFDAQTKIVAIQIIDNEVRAIIRFKFG